jgi:hypothetical protein
LRRWVWSQSSTIAPDSPADQQAISVGETESASSKCITAIADGACDLDASSYKFPLPTIPKNDNKKRYTPTLEFIEGMIEAFKSGGKLPKRVVWEIILGVKAIVDKERSMVERVVDEGVVCDIVGDTHGVSDWESGDWRELGFGLMDSNSSMSSISWTRSDYHPKST